MSHSILFLCEHGDGGGDGSSGGGGGGGGDDMVVCGFLFWLSFHAWKSIDTE